MICLELHPFSSAQLLFCSAAARSLIRSQIQAGELRLTTRLPHPTTSGKSLDAVAELSTAARLPESDCGSGCVQPLSRTATVPMKMDATPSRSFARRMNRYLLVTMYTVRVQLRREVLQR